MPTSGGTYVIINKKSGTAADLSGEDQRSVIGFNVHRGDNQQWTFTQESDGSWHIRNVYNGKYLDADTPKKIKDGERVVAVDTDNPRKWDVRQDERDPNGWCIFIQGTNVNVDLSDHGDPTPGTPVALWGKWNGDNQVWRLEEA